MSARKLPSIVMICPGVTQLQGGMQRQLWLQTRALAKRGHGVYVLQRRDPELAGRPEDWSHATFIECWPPFPDKASALLTKYRAPGLAFVVSGFIALWRHRREIDVLHAHQLYSQTLVGALAGFFLRKPLVVKVTASGELGEVREIERLPFRALRKFIFRRIATCIALTTEMKEELEAFGFGPARVTIIPNGVFIGPESPRRRNTPSADTEAFKILFSGRLSEEKRLDLLIEAAATAARAVPEVRFEVHLVGAPFASRDPMPKLRRLTELHRERVQVYFHGFRSDVSADYAGADVFALPSDSEGMSNALLEAMSHGLCCVASDIRPNRELIEDGQTGLLFKKGDAGSLAEALIRLARDGDGALARRLGQNARRKVTEFHSAERIAAELSGLYERVLAGGPR